MRHSPGPELADVHYEELERPYLIAKLVWIHVAFVKAATEGVDEPVLQALLEGFNEVFEHLVAVDEDFRKRVINTPWKPPQGFQAKKEYVEIAQRYSAS